MEQSRHQLSLFFFFKETETVDKNRLGPFCIWVCLEVTFLWGDDLVEEGCFLTGFHFIKFGRKERTPKQKILELNGKFRYTAENETMSTWKLDPNASFFRKATTLLQHCS